ncbi:MAG: class I SAM-dependent methyltransferase [Chitinivibrionales bacterium]|nr:class I SAM-dependent methyltransferase [Chitinivibrionales bacterium]
MQASPVANWDSYWEKKNLLPQVKIIEELEDITAFAGRTVIEIGAGSGTTAMEIARKGASVTCLDFSAAAIALMRKNIREAGQTLSLVQGDAFKIPLQKESFDICYHQGFLEHFPDSLPLLREQNRILKPGGYLLLDVPQRYNLYTVKKHFRIIRKQWFAGWEKEFSLRELRGLLKETGFSFVKGFGRFHGRHLDRIQHAIVGKTIIPPVLERLYYRSVKAVENTPIGCYTAFAVGVIGRKE